MQLQAIDWVVVAIYGIASLLIGIVFTERAGRSLEQYFLSGRKLPWWLLGTSMVATTFSTDTPNLVTDVMRNGGVSLNWLWWAFLITGMLTVFFYAKLWRRSGALTDINFYELRYSIAPAAFLRGSRAIYLGVFFNIMIMATVTLAAIKIAGVLLGLDPYVTVVLAALITMVYATHCGPVGRGGDGLLSICPGDDRLVRRCLLRRLAAERRRLKRPDVQPSCTTSWRCSRIFPMPRPCSPCSSCRLPCSGGARGIRAPSPAVAATSRSACWPPLTRSRPWLRRCGSTLPITR